jgi:AspT/YidE/YbjL antiporter-like protein
MVIDVLAGNPLLVLFLVVASGYLFGRIRMGGFSLGVAGVLFTGIAVGAVDPRLGLVLFLAGIGTRAGQSFAVTVAAGSGWMLLGLALTLSLVVALVVLTVGHRMMRLPMGVTLGILAGLSTQPATLAFASEQTDNRLPELGYATVFPAAMLAKILLAQLVLGVA